MEQIGEYIKRYGSQPVTPTPRLLRYWCNRLNDELFNGGATVEDIEIKALGHIADCDGETIRIDIRDYTRSLLLSTLAHELIHVLQWHRSRPLDHGKFFHIQATRLQKALGVAVK